MQYKILIVDDDENICELLRLYLEKDGFETVVANDGEQAVDYAAKYTPDLILLDIMLPKLDGWQVCREIRKSSDVPIIMLTAKGETFDKILGLELGADDYISKPFDTKEVIARIKAVLRRSRKETASSTLSAGDITLDAGRRQVTVAGEAVTLTRKEFDLLETLMRNRGLVLTREKLLDTVWGIDFPGDTRTVDVHMGTLRQKLGAGAAMLQTVRGVGYRMED